jgi:maltose O-acetyltransferase
MNPIDKMKRYYNRFRLLMNSNFYTEYLRRQGVKIGKDSVVLYPSYVDGRLPYLLEIGDKVIISLYVTILTHDATTAYAGDLVKVGRITIKDHSFIGANSTILCNVTIGPDSIVGAGSVVSRDVPPGTIYAGNPARFVCNVNDFIEKHREMSKHLPFFEGDKFRHPYIAQEEKDILKKGLRNTPGYFCAKLPTNRNPMDVLNRISNPMTSNNAEKDTSTAEN